MPVASGFSFTPATGSLGGRDLLPSGLFNVAPATGGRGTRSSCWIRSASGKSL